MAEFFSVLIYVSVTPSCPVSQHITPLPAPFLNTPGKSKMDKWVKKIQADKTPRTLEVRVRERVRERAGQERALLLMLADMLRVQVSGSRHASCVGSAHCEALPAAAPMRAGTSTLTQPLRGHPLCRN